MSGIAAAGPSGEARFTVQTSEIIRHPTEVAKQIMQEIQRRKGPVVEYGFNVWPENKEERTKQILTETIILVLGIKISAKSFDNKDRIMEEMIEKGVELLGIHPLTQLVFLATEKSTKNPSRSLLQDLMNAPSFKTKIYIKSLSLSLLASLKRAELLLYISDFAEAIKQPNKISELSIAASLEKWEDFLNLICKK